MVLSDGQIISIFGLAERARGLVEKLSDLKQARVILPAKPDDIRDAFVAGEIIIAVMASGALIRILAPVLNNKHTEPPVLAICEDGLTVVPLLGGHHGANEIARYLAAQIGAYAAITTASDSLLNVSLDEPPSGYKLANAAAVKPVTTSLLDGHGVRLNGHAPWLGNIVHNENAKASITVTDNDVEPDDLNLVFHPQTYVLGMGCERFCDCDETINLAREVIQKAGISQKSIAAVTSIDLKCDEAAIHAVADYLNVEARFFSSIELEAQKGRLKNPSEIVFAEVGCHGVAEGAALAAAGPMSDLIIEKTKSKSATAAIARAEKPIVANTIGKKQGRLFVVGLGPGKSQWRSPEVSKMLRLATDWVGYSLYLDLANDVYTGQNCHEFPLGDEEKRVCHALELASEGKDVALICSGDAGIYAMATLVFEAMDKQAVSPAARRVDVQISPGISALQAAAARSGAPLGHDFCTISLSDLLTPWAHIQQRVKAAAEGDFVIAFYNPVSKRRRTQLAYARDVLLEHRPAETPVILATSLGRPQEKVQIVNLADLKIDDVDMLTTVVVGSTQSRIWASGSGQKWVYTPRGYCAKSGSKLGDSST